MSTRDEILARLSGRRVIASVSGGKDSAALSLWLSENGIEHDRVFMDTGWEHEATYEYLRGPLTKKIGPITEIRSKKGTLEEIVRARGMFPSRLRRFCTQESKVFPMRDFIRDLQDRGEEVANAVGIRAAESQARSKMLEWEEDETFDCLVWRPLIAWSEAQVIEIHKRHGLTPNPLYLMGASRVGCWPCIFARKSEIRLIAEKDPARINRLRVLEADVQVAARARFERDNPKRVADHEASLLPDGAHGPSLPEPRDFSPPTWFQGRERLSYPIDEVIEWSKTSRGGAQFEMFAADPADAGCMRWGLCDTKGDE